MQCWAAAQNICSSPHPADFLCHRSPASHGFAKLCWTGARLLFNFCASSRHKLPTLGTFSPFFASGVNSRCKKSTFCLDRRGKGLDSGGKTCRYNRMNKATRLFTKKILAQEPIKMPMPGQMAIISRSVLCSLDRCQTLDVNKYANAGMHTRRIEHNTQNQ